METSWVSKQIKELLHPPVVHLSRCEKHYVPNLWGSAIYDASCCWGRLWRAFWSLVRLVDWGGKLEHRLLIKVVKKVKEQWEEALVSIRPHLECFDVEMRRRIDSDTPAEASEESLLSLKKLTDWQDHILEAFQDEGLGTVDHKIRKVEQICLSLLQQNEETSPETICLVHKVADANAVIDLEKKIKKGLPYAAFKKLAENQEVENSESVRLQEFLGKLTQLVSHKRLHKRVGVRQLHRALKTIVETNPLQENALGYLEWQLHSALIGQGCEIFLQVDEEHRKWVEQYHRREKVEFADYQVGREINGRKIERESHRVFELDEESTLVFNTKNQALPFLEWMEGIKSVEEWPCARLQKIEHSVAFYERLLENPDQSSWGEYEENEETQKRFQSLTAFIASMIKNDWMPALFSAQSVRFDQDNQLKLTRPSKKEKFNYDRVASFISSSFASYPALEEALVEESGLNYHSIAKLYHSLATNEEEEVEEQMEALGLSSINGKEVILCKAEQIKGSVALLVQSLKAKIQQKYKVASEEELRIDLRNKVADEAKRRASFSLVGLNQEEMIEALIQFKPLKMRKSSFQRCVRNIEVDDALRRDRSRCKDFVVKACRDHGIYDKVQQLQAIKELLV